MTRTADARAGVTEGTVGPAKMLRIAGLVKVYGGSRPVRAVDGVDLEVNRGELFGLLGPNGAGKTTTVGVATTRVRPDAGSVHVGDVDVLADPAVARRVVGVVTQFNTLDRSCTVWENLYFHCRFFGLSHAEARRRTQALLEQFRIADRARDMPDQLSGGTQQRLQVARSVAHDPAVLFLDEPTAGLDPQSRLAVWELVGDLRAHGVTVFLTTHYMEEADALCDRVAIIDHGRILVIDTPANLKQTVDADTIINLRLAERAEELTPRLLALEGVRRVEQTDEGLRIMTQAGNGVLQRVVDAAHGYQVRDVSVREPTLETVFIALTGRDLRD